MKTRGTTSPLRNHFSALFPHETPLRPLISQRLQTLFGFSSIFISTPHIRFNTLTLLLLCFYAPTTHACSTAECSSMHTTQGSTPAPSPSTQPQTTAVQPSPPALCIPLKTCPTATNPLPQQRTPSPPLQQHVILGRCLQLCHQQAAADAARLRLRQLRRDGEMRCRSLLCALGVQCTWLVTLLLRRLLRFASALWRAGPCFCGGGGCGGRGGGGSGSCTAGSAG